MLSEIKIKTEYIKLDQLLKYIGISQTGGESKIYIKKGMVKVNGKITYERGKKIKSGDKIYIEGKGSYLVK